MAHEGDMYVFSKHIPVEVNNGRIINPDGVDAVQGCVAHPRELWEPPMRKLPPLWTNGMQMVQLAPGERLCECCGDVRHQSYFDVLVSATPDTPPKYDHWCKQCRNEHDPRLRTTKYCSCCKQDKRRSEFSVDERNVDGLRTLCKTCRAQESRDDYRVKVGRDVRHYERKEVAV